MTNQPNQPAAQQQDPMALRVNPRSDLRVSRHLRAGEPAYVIQDPISFATHRLNDFQYLVLTSIEPAQTLGENFARLVGMEAYEQDEQDLFLAQIGMFRKLGLVVMPMSGAKLYEQSQSVRKMRRRGKILGALFAQFPLVRPNEFLQRTIPFFSWLFTRSFAVVWLMGMIAACSVIVARFSDFTQPFSGLLATKNLPFLWLSFVVLKVWHELGHGYACKKYGGFVPEMGMILIAGTPAAYVDASAAWSFPKRSQRLAVMCGGMFFESLIFIPSVFLWAFSSSPMVAACAHQLVVLASLATILFNANPLMRFDGYFILSELIGIQNLRPRADKQIKGALSKLTLGMQPPATSDSLLTRFLLFVYGVSASIYKFFLVIGIAATVALKFPMVGLIIAGFYIVVSAAQTGFKTLWFLLKSPETEPVRGRARLVAVALMIGLPLGLAVLPVPTGVTSQGLVSAETEHFINVDTPGVFQDALLPVGSEVKANQPLSKLDNPRAIEDLRIAEASLGEAKVREKVAALQGPGAVAWERTNVSELASEVAEHTKLVRSLTLVSPADGRVVWQRPETDRGSFLSPGQPIAQIASGRTVIRTWVDEEQLGSIDLAVGGRVEFRVPGRSTSTFGGEILSVQPASEDIFHHTAVTHITGGNILLDPQTGRPFEPVFQIDVLPDQSTVHPDELNARVQLMLPRQRESIGGWAYRNCIRFVRSLLVA